MRFCGICKKFEGGIFDGFLSERKKECERNLRGKKRYYYAVGLQFFLVLVVVELLHLGNFIKNGLSDQISKLVCGGCFSFLGCFFCFTPKMILSIVFLWGLFVCGVGSWTLLEFVDRTWAEITRFNKYYSLRPII